MQPNVKRCHNVMAEFDKACTSPTTSIWLINMTMVMILKRFTHAERTCLRAEHLTEVEHMLPYLVANGRCMYVSCLSHYLEMTRGQHTLALKILKAFQDGSFTVLQTNRREIELCLCIYMTLQQIYTREAKTKSLTGISQQPATSTQQPWINTCELFQFWQQSHSRQRQWPTWIWMTPSSFRTPTGKRQRRQIALRK